MTTIDPKTIKTPLSAKNGKYAQGFSALSAKTTRDSTKISTSALMILKFLLNEILYIIAY